MTFQNRSLIFSCELMMLFMEELITFMPTNSKPNPIKTYASALKKGFFVKRIITIPTKARAAKISVMGRDCKESIRPVTVVPILAPMMMEDAWNKVRMPELTRPTTITVVAAELWITALTVPPIKIPLKRLEVRRERAPRSFLPDNLVRLSLSTCIPNIMAPSPASNNKMYFAKSPIYLNYKRLSRNVSNFLHKKR